MSHWYIVFIVIDPNEAVGLRCKENVTTIIDLVKLVNQEQVTKVLEELADECCFWNGEKMFSYTSNNSFHCKCHLNIFTHVYS